MTSNKYIFNNVKCSVCGATETINEDNIYFGFSHEYQFMYRCFSCGRGNILDRRDSNIPKFIPMLVEDRVRCDWKKFRFDTDCCGWKRGYFDPNTVCCYFDNRLFCCLSQVTREYIVGKCSMCPRVVAHKKLISSLSHMYSSIDDHIKDREQSGLT